MSNSLIGFWDLKTRVVGDRDFPNHCLIFLKASILDWCLKPFKFSNSWLKHKKLIPFVDLIRRSLNVRGKKCIFSKKN